MGHENQDEGLIRRYLLGQLAEDELQQLEERLMADNDLFDRMLLAEDEMVEEYVQDELPASDRARFEASFLTTPEGRHKVAYAKALRKYVAAVKPTPLPDIPIVWWRRPALVPYVAAAAALSVIGLGLGILQIISPSEMSKGLAALPYAYRDQRPLEARISGFNYAPASTTRGGEAKVDRTARNLAESVLLDAVLKHPNATTHHAAGRLYLAEKKFDEAIEQFEKAIKTDPNNAQLHSDYGAALFEMGRAGNDGGTRLEFLARALEQFQRAIELNGSQLEALFNKALCHFEIGLAEQAREDWQRYLEEDSNSKWADEARRRLKELEDKRQQRTLLSPEAIYNDFLAAYQTRDDASAWEALRLGRSRAGNLVTERLLDSFLGHAEGTANEAVKSCLSMLSYAGALEYRKASDRFTEDVASFYKNTVPAQRRTLAEARRVMKSAAERQTRNEYEEAVKFYSKARQLFERADDICEAKAAQELVGISKLRIEPKESLSILKPLCLVFKERGYLHLLALALGGVADAESSSRNISESLTASSQANQLSEQIEDFNGILRNWQTPVAMYIRVGDYRKSLRWVSDAFDLASRFSPDPAEIWSFYHQAAMDCLSLDLTRAALEFEREALRLALESGRPLLKSRSYARLGVIYEKLQNHDEAIRNAYLALAEGDNVDGPKIRANMIANSALQLAELYGQRGDLELAVTLYDKSIQTHANLNLEGYIFEAHRGKLLALTKLNDEAAVARELMETIPLIEQYRPKISEEASRNSFFDLAQSIYNIAIDFSHTRTNDDQAFNYAEESHGRSLLDLMKSNQPSNSVTEKSVLEVHSVASPLTLDEIELRLPDRAKVVQYCVLDDKVLVWVVSKRPLETREWRIDANILEKKVHRFVELVRSDADDVCQEREELSRELYDILMGLVEPFLNETDYLCIIPDGILDHLPFGALVSSNSGKYFVEDHVFVQSPSCTIFLACTDIARRKTLHREERFLGVGNPDFDRSKFPGLPSSEEEIRDIARLFEQPMPLIGRQAKEGLIKGQMRRADVVHFASHYVVDERSPLMSKLLLARENVALGSQSEDGYLLASEIYGMTLPRTRLVVLSACQTGIERSYRAEGAISIARPFIKAGVPIVVASLWSVDSDSPSTLMITFHRHRKEGLSTAEALCRAQREMLNSPDKRNHLPYHWAAFATIGGYAVF